LPWSAFLEVLPVEDALAREFYITMAANERWSVRQLRNQMDAMLYERTLISRKPEDVIKTELSTVRQGGAISPDLVFKSPYFLDFTGLKGYYSEKKLEDMIISGVQRNGAEGVPSDAGIGEELVTDAPFNYPLFQEKLYSQKCPGRDGPHPRQHRNSGERLGISIATKRIFRSDPGLLDNPDNQGNEIHDETIEDRYKADFDAA